MSQVAAVRVFCEACRDGQMLVDLFVNYDCDLDSSSLFERMVNALVRLAQTPVAVGVGCVCYVVMFNSFLHVQALIAV
jgi:brefeldin A-inhibited guanine nucleotide-exchange protein